MRVYILLIYILITALMSIAAVADDDDHEVRVVGDKNFNNATLIYDGIDVSNYQKDINWEATASDANIKYVYIKATEGATHRQHRYRYNLENARKHGVKVGSYHFLRTGTSIQSQFNNFISLVKREEQDLVPLLDVETREGWTIKQLQDSVMKFAQLLEDHFGCKPMIYTSSSYFNNYLGPSFAGYPLFIARYSKSEPQLYFGAKWILWQFSDRGRIDGIDAMVDLSRFNRGCSLKDIAYKTIKPSSPRHRRNNGEVPRPKVKHEEKPYVPYPRQRQNLNVPKTKEDEEIQRRGEEAARKRQEIENKRLEEERKAQEKLRKEEEKKRKEIEKRQREIEKRRAAEEKKRLEEEKKRLEQEKKRQEQELKRQREEAKLKARQQAQNRMKTEKESNANNQQDATAQQEQQRRGELEQAKQERLKQQQQQSSASSQSTTKHKSKYTPKGNNQSSADNDAIKYNRNRKK